MSDYQTSNDPHDPVEYIREGFESIRRKRRKPDPIFIGPELEHEFRIRGWLDDDGLAGLELAVARDEELAIRWNRVAGAGGRLGTDIALAEWLRARR